MTSCRRKLAAIAVVMAASVVQAADPNAEKLLAAVDISHPVYGTKTFGATKSRGFLQPDGSLLLVFQAKYGGDGDHSENRLKLFRFRDGRHELLLDQNIDFVAFVEKGRSLTLIRGMAVESLCDTCDGWDAAEPEDVFLIPIVIDAVAMTVRSELTGPERTELLARFDRQAHRRVAELARHREKYPSYVAAVRARIVEVLAGRTASGAGQGTP